MLSKLEYSFLTHFSHRTPKLESKVSKIVQASVLVSLIAFVLFYIFLSICLSDTRSCYKTPRRSSPLGFQELGLQAFTTTCDPIFPTHWQLWRPFLTSSDASLTSRDVSSVSTTTAAGGVVNDSLAEVLGRSYFQLQMQQGKDEETTSPWRHLGIINNAIITGIKVGAKK